MARYHFGGSRGPSRFNRKKNVRRGARIDVSKFINKTVVHQKPPEYIPRHTFGDFALDPRLKHNVIRKGYLNPTPIQDQAIPLVLAGKDVVGIANTGTGKTAVFLLPLLNKLIQNRHQRVLIMTPTRELAQQIQQELQGFGHGLGFRSVLCIGGVSIGRQIRDLRHGSPHFLIGTPGRIQDLVERRALNLSGFQNVVLDEADRMLDMGFIQDMRRILAMLPKPRHSLFFSATCSRAIADLITTFLNQPVTISVKVQETAANIHQDVIRFTDSAHRMRLLEDLLKNTQVFQKVLIFGRTKHGVEKLSIQLTRSGYHAGSIHGNKTQSSRLRTLQLFKENKVRILVATDVAARGLDINDVSHVINFDVPESYEDYVHRIGRTGRANKSGVALTFVDQYA